MDKSLTLIGLTCLLLTVAACGDNVGERAATGGVAGALVAGPVGAVVGGAAGAVSN